MLEEHRIRIACRFVDQIIGAAFLIRSPASTGMASAVVADEDTDAWIRSAVCAPVDKIGRSRFASTGIEMTESTRVKAGLRTWLRTGLRITVCDRRLGPWLLTRHLPRWNDEDVVRHIAFADITANDIGKSSIIYQTDLLPRESVLIPESITVSNIEECFFGDSSSQRFQNEILIFARSDLDVYPDIDVLWIDVQICKFSLESSIGCDI